MRIAQVAPLWDSLPPETHRSVAFSVSSLTDELVRRGHDVTLFAPGDSDTLAWLESSCERSLNHQKIRLQDYPLYEQIQLNRVFNCPGRFDIIHVHDSLAALAHSAFSKTPVLQTVYHRPTALEEQVYLQYRRQPLVMAYPGFKSTSAAHQLKVMETIPAPIDLDAWRFYSQGKTASPYLAYIGDLSEENGLAQAIEIAHRAGMPLHVATLQDDVAESSFSNCGFAKARIDGQQIKFRGCIPPYQRNEFLGHAVAALIMNLSFDAPPWSLMESLASGTAVIAMDPQLKPWLHGEQLGVIAGRLEDCVAAIQQVASFDREHCRQWAKSRFSPQSVADAYERVYGRLLQRRSPRDRSQARLQVAS